MTPIDICRALLTSVVPAESLPEMSDDDTRQEVRRRLHEVGCELVYSHHFDCWTARLTGALSEAPISDSPNFLNAMDLAVLAACWLHLRFLPSENARLPVDSEESLFERNDEPLVVPLDQAELVNEIPTLHRNAISISIGKLKRAKFLVQRDSQLVAGPMMDTIDEVRATEQARRLMLRHQRLSRQRRQAPVAQEDSVDSADSAAVFGEGSSAPD